MWLLMFTAALSVILTHALDLPSSSHICTNISETNDTSMVVDCTGISVDSGSLFRHLDRLFSDDDFKRRLTSLQISNTPLTRVPTSLCQLSKLTALTLDRNRLTQLSVNCFTNMTHLRSFSANDNNITELRGELFDGLRNLENISLSRNQIAKIGPRVFTQQARLVSLTTVALNENLLSTLEPWPLILGVSRSAEKPLLVAVRSNRISTLTNSVGYRYHCRLPPTFFRVDFAHNLLPRLSDMLRGWGLNKTHVLCLLRYRCTFRLAHNPFICDCRDFKFYSTVHLWPRLGIFHEVYCSEPTELYGEAIIRIPLNAYTCDIRDGCPVGCRCAFRPANVTVHIDCPRNNMASLPVELPPLPRTNAVYKLDFSNNKRLRRLTHRPYFARTSFMDVSHCSVEEIGFEAWKSLVNVSVVLLNDNRIAKLPRAYSEVSVASGSIDLHDNPWECSCERGWMQDWLKSVSRHLANPNSILCQSPPRLHGTSIVRARKESFCVDKVQRAITVSLSSVFGSVALLLFVGVAAYCLRVRLHDACWKCHPFDRDECDGEHMQFDVYFSYCVEDSDTHARLADLFEAKGYRVFRPSDVDFGEDAVSPIRRSRRTVFLLSRHFIQSEQCLGEFRTALEYNSKRDKRIVVLSLLDNQLVLYSNACAEAAALRRFVRDRQRRCIDVNDRRWRDKLLYALPVRPLPTANGVDRAPDAQDDLPLITT